MPQGELQELVQSFPAYSYVVDFSGDVVAALMSRPLGVMPCMHQRVLSACCCKKVVFRLGCPCLVAERWAHSCMES